MKMEPSMATISIVVVTWAHPMTVRGYWDGRWSGVGVVAGSWATRERSVIRSADVR